MLLLICKINMYVQVRMEGNEVSKFSNDVKELLEYVGGKENIAAVSHCATRMRFVLNDPKKADVKKIDAMKVVKGTFTQAGQFQVIIGNEVPVFYNEFVRYAGIEGVSKEGCKTKYEPTSKTNITPWRNICTTYSSNSCWRSYSWF